MKTDDVVEPRRLIAGATDGPAAVEVHAASQTTMQKLHASARLH